MDIPEELPSSATERNKLNDAIANGENSKLELSDMISETKTNIQELLEELKNTQEAINDLKEKYTESEIEYKNAFDQWRSQIASSTGIPFEAVDFTGEYSDLHPKLQDIISKTVTDMFNDFVQLQEESGEAGKGPAESPSTTKKLQLRLNDADTADDPSENENKEKKKGSGLKALMIVLFFFAAFGIIGKVSQKTIHDHLSKNKLSTMIPTGCYQLHLASGSMRTIGICGLQDYCNNSKDEGSCNSIPNGVCQWNSGTNTCGPSQAVTNASSCCTSCTSTGDCNAGSKQCNKDADCGIGTCVGNRCQYQTCDKSTLECTPCPSLDPDYPVIKQLQDGNLGFCKAGISLSTCGSATSICRPNNGDGTGGACSVCDSGSEECTNPAGIYSKKSTCLCPKGTGWITQPMCVSYNDFYFWLFYLYQIRDDWVTPTTPLITKLIFIFSILLFVATFIWYIRYLIKYRKKN